MPSAEQVAIGGGRRLNLAVLFLDISAYTSWLSASAIEQKRILWIMDIFMAEMMNIIRDHGGIFEKNTGDGLMAYFGTETSSDEESVRPAVEAAVLMHYVNDQLISPWLTTNGLWPVTFRVGIDYGGVTIARIGIHGTNTFVAIGSPANIANRLLRQIKNGICIGNEVYKHLPGNWGSTCVALPAETGYFYELTGVPYPIWELRHRMASNPWR